VSIAEIPRVRLGRRQIVRRFSPDEDAAIERMRIAGAGTSEIAIAVSALFGKPRSPATINMRLKTLAARDEA
jgi:hypothetical protein